jgi:uncharacterized protein (TIGR03089 family)
MQGFGGTVVSAFADLVRSEPGRPFLTSYDDTSGERVELSAATFDNWVTKLANLLVDEWDLQPGEPVRVDLPAHWQTFVALMGTWSCGLVVCTDPAVAVAASIVGPTAVAGGTVASDFVLACSLRPLGQAYGTPLPTGWEDWANSVTTQPDVIVMPRVVRAVDAARVTPGGTATHADLLDRGGSAAQRLGLRPGGRLLTDVNPASTDGLDVALLAPLVTGSSVVLLPDSSDARREAVAAQERVTCEAVFRHQVREQENHRP